MHHFGSPRPHLALIPLAGTTWQCLAPLASWVFPIQADTWDIRRPYVASTQVQRTSAEVHTSHGGSHPPWETRVVDEVSPLSLPGHTVLGHSVLACLGCPNTCLRLSGLNNRHLFSHGFGGWKSKIKVSAGFAPAETFLLGLQTVAFLLSFHGHSWVCPCLKPLFF